AARHRCRAHCSQSRARSAHGERRRRLESRTPVLGHVSLAVLRGSIMNKNHVQRVVALLLGTSAVAHAAPGVNTLPTGGQVVRGDASLQAEGARLNITQRSDKAVLNWQSFDIGRDATVSFAQPSKNSIALNRVMSADPSEIFGQLLANGHVFLSNPNGVLIG